MQLIMPFLQVIVAFGLLNVWLIRLNQPTPYRGASSQSLKDEFAAYGLPAWSFYLIGFLKISSAILLLIGLWIPIFIFPAALVVSVLMTGAILMHIKVKDPLKKALPASIMLALSVAICFASLNAS